MKARDERVALMNEVCYYPDSHSVPNLSAVGPWRNPDAQGDVACIRPYGDKDWVSPQFMAWERSFEARILKVRDKELKYQKLNYAIEVTIV